MRRTKNIISDFREVIELYNYTTTTDSAGGSKPTYNLYTSTLSRVQGYDGDLFIEGGQRVINNKFAFTIRYRTGGITFNSTSVWEEVLTFWENDAPNINKQFKIKYRGDYYIIHSIIFEDERREYFKIIAWKRS